MRTQQSSTGMWCGMASAPGARTTGTCSASPARPGGTGTVKLTVLAQRRWSGWVCCGRCVRVCDPQRGCIADLVGVLFPDVSSLVVEGVEDTAAGLVVRVRSTAPEAAYPRCGGLSRRVHAWRTRRLADLPVAGRPVVGGVAGAAAGLPGRAVLSADVREQVPDLARRWARRTVRLGGMIGRTAAALAGRAGSSCWPGSGSRCRGRRCCGR
jgi:hypothetical protein